MEENTRNLGENQSAGNQGKKGTSNRGFASMTPEKQKEIASKGGKAAHEQGVAHQWNPEEARNAGRKGGQSVSQNREHMAEIGRKGGQASRGGGRSNAKNNAENTNAAENTDENSNTEGTNNAEGGDGNRENLQANWE